MNKFASTSLITKESGKITNFQFEALRKSLRRTLKKKAQIFFRIFPSIPITKKSNNVRLGRGKGNVSYFCSYLKKNEAILELRYFDAKLSNNVLKVSKKKIGIKTFIFNQESR
jgi:large subunit ribosomal protein L16